MRPATTARTRHRLGTVSRSWAQSSSARCCHGPCSARRTEGATAYGSSWGWRRSAQSGTASGQRPSRGREL
eukprot:2869069-Alexandrium_andersonii.AAC.1